MGNTHMQQPSIDANNPMETVFCHAADAVKVTPFPTQNLLFYVAKGMIPSCKFGRSRLFKKIRSHRRY